MTLGASGSVTDTVTVSGNSTGGAPTGNVSFYWCYDASSSPTGCNSSGNAAGSPGLTTGTPTADQSQATSTGFTPGNAGFYCFFATYGGDNNYSGSSENLANPDQAALECFHITQASSATTTQSSTTGSVTLGASGSVTDTVTVSGNSTGGAPTGNVSFYWCYNASSSPTGCNSSGTAAGSPGLTTGTPTADQSQATSTGFTPGNAGYYCFFATYGGDNNYTGSSEDLTNPDQAALECFHITKAPSTTTTHSSQTGSAVLGATGSVTDTATVSGNSTGGAPTGNVSFYWCYDASSSPTGCNSSGNAAGSPGLTTGTPTADQSQATSTGFTPSKVGFYCFYASYSGDGNYQASSEDLSNKDQASLECFQVTPASSQTATLSSLTGSAVLGATGSVTDTATVSGNGAGGAPPATCRSTGATTPARRRPAATRRAPPRARRG